LIPSYQHGAPLVGRFPRSSSSFCALRYASVDLWFQLFFFLWDVLVPCSALSYNLASFHCIRFLPQAPSILLPFYPCEPPVTCECRRRAGSSRCQVIVPPLTIFLLAFLFPDSVSASLSFDDVRLPDNLFFAVLPPLDCPCQSKRTVASVTPLSSPPSDLLFRER